MKREGKPPFAPANDACLCHGKPSPCRCQFLPAVNGKPKPSRAPQGLGCARFGLDAGASQHMDWAAAFCLHALAHQKQLFGEK